MTAAIARHRRHCLRRRRRRRTFVVGAERPQNPTLVVGPPTDGVFGDRTAVRRRRPAVSAGPRLDVRPTTAAAAATEPVAARMSATVSPAVRTFNLRHVFRRRRVDRRFRNRLPCRTYARPRPRCGTVGHRFRSIYRRFRSSVEVSLGAVAPADHCRVAGGNGVFRPQPAAPATVAANGTVLRVPHTVAPAFVVGPNVRSVHPAAAIGCDRTEKQKRSKRLIFFFCHSHVTLRTRDFDELISFTRTLVQPSFARPSCLINPRGSQRCATVTTDTTETIEHWFNFFVYK